jgi:hypothetical protein
MAAKASSGAAERASAHNATPADAGLNPGDDAAPGTPGTGENICPECKGTGRIGSTRCPNCGGSGKVVSGLAGG